MSNSATLYSGNSLEEDSIPTLHFEDNIDDGEVVYYDYDEIFDELYVDVNSDKPIEMPIKKRRRLCSPTPDEITLTFRTDDSEQANTLSPKIVDSNDSDVDFFKSLLPEMARMSHKQKVQMKQSVLKLVDDILYMNINLEDDISELEEDISNPDDSDLMFTVEAIEANVEMEEDQTEEEGNRTTDETYTTDENQTDEMPIDENQTNENQTDENQTDENETDENQTDGNQTD